MKKLLFGTAVVLLMASCSGNNASDKANDDSARIVDSIAQIEETKAAAEQAREDSIRQDSIAKAEELAKATAQYDPMLDKYESLINKCWSMSKKGMTINDQELADVWMAAGDEGTKLGKVKNKLNPEQQTRLKKLDKDYEKFCRTQPA